ncbi:hypothetical protein Fmac_018453 [Flemingia macrophylla]|uniref:Uncharacterized protein n=1 Tax=Flemingia macrophylla TaxID=520843 RepID=A0ABD1M5F5_9FABA
MKFNLRVSSSRRKSRKDHFIASSSMRHVLMRAPLLAELQCAEGGRGAGGARNLQGARGKTDSGHVYHHKCQHPSLWL